MNNVNPTSSHSTRNILQTLILAAPLMLAICLYSNNAFSSIVAPRQERLAQNKGKEVSLLVDVSSSTPDLILALQRSTLKYQRRYAAELLGDRGAEAIPALLKALGDPEEVVKKAAAESLAKINDKSIIPELIEKLRSPDPQVRQYSAYVLGRIAKKKDKAVVDALQEAAEDKDTNARVEVIYALTTIGAPSSKSIFIRALNDPEPRARSYAAIALGNLKDPEGGKALALALDRETDQDTLRMIISSIGKIGRAGSVNTLVEALSHDIPSLRADITVALGEIKTPEATCALIALLSDPDVNVRARAAVALRDRKDPMVVRALVDALKDRSVMVRRPASEALISLADTSVVKELTEALGDSDSTVADNAAKALIQLNDLDAVHGLMKALDSSDRNEVARAINVLEEITHREFGPDVEKWKAWYDENFKSETSS